MFLAFVDEILENDEAFKLSKSFEAVLFSSSVGTAVYNPLQGGSEIFLSKNVSTQVKAQYC